MIDDYSKYHRRAIMGLDNDDTPITIQAPTLAFIVVDKQGKYIKSYGSLRYAKSFRTRNGGLYDIYRTVTVEKVEVE